MRAMYRVICHSTGWLNTSCWQVNNTACIVETSMVRWETTSDHFALQLQVKWMHPCLVCHQNVTSTGNGGGQQNIYATYLPLPQEFVRLWKKLAGKNSFLLQLLFTKFCVCMSAHCAYEQLLLLLASAVSSHWALLAFTRHQMLPYHRVWDPEFSFSSLPMCAIFPSIVLKLKLVLFPIVQHCVHTRSSCTFYLQCICSLLMPPIHGVHSLTKTILSWCHCT